MNFRDPHRLGQALEGNPIPDHQLGWYTQFNNRCFSVDGRPKEAMFDDGAICFHDKGVSFIQGNVYAIDTRIDGSGTKRQLVVTQVDSRVKLEPGWRIGEVHSAFYITPFVHTLQAQTRPLLEAPGHWGEDEGGI